MPSRIAMPMRLRSTIALLAACLTLLTGATAAYAQQPQRQRNLFEMFWQMPAQPQRVEPRRAAPPPQQRRRPPPVVVRDDPVIPKVDVAHRILVIGDSLAQLVASGLDESLEDRPDVEVIGRARSDSGLVRTDFYDWPKVAGEIAGSEQKLSAVIVMLGLNDRQAIREGDTVHEPLSPRWLELYRARVDSVIAAFAARRIPLIWIGAPPVQNQRLSADFVAFNDVFRQQVERAGGQYVDLWEAFVDGENRYTASGPDVSGQPMRLRMADGIHFTKAGARKAAHFADVLIRRLIEAPPPAGAIAVPAPDGSPTLGAPARPLDDREIERMINHMVAGLPTLGLPAALQAKPLAGPILPLTGAAARAGAETSLLATAAEARGLGEASAELDRILRDGMIPDPKPGRSDDHRWPR